MAPTRLVVTVDDLPANGGLLPGWNRMNITRGVLKALKDHGLTQVYGFANGMDIGTEPGLIDVLKEWLRAGYPVGNHSYNHPHLNSMSAQAYIADIEKMDRLLLTLTPVSPLVKEHRVFRYPFMEEGATLAKRDAVRSYLFKKGYRIAEVTVDYDDWAWNAAYSRCVNQHDQKSIAWLKSHIVDDAERRLLASERMAALLFHRDIPQILLVHDGIFDAIMLGAILTDYHAKGVKFISFDKAMTDPVYHIDTNYAYPTDETFLEQIAESRHVDIGKLEDATYPVDGLNKVCSQVARGATP